MLRQLAGRDACATLWTPRRDYGATINLPLAIEGARHLLRGIRHNIHTATGSYGIDSIDAHGEYAPASGLASTVMFEVYSNTFNINAVEFEASIISRAIQQ